MSENGVLNDRPSFVVPPGPISNLPAWPPAKKRKVCPDDVEAMARLIADRMTETEACAVLDIEPRAWFRWKGRRKNVGVFDSLRARLTGERIRQCLGKIAQAGDGSGHPALEKRGPDWRAS